MAGKQVLSCFASLVVIVIIVVIVVSIDLKQNDRWTFLQDGAPTRPTVTSTNSTITLTQGALATVNRSGNVNPPASMTQSRKLYNYLTSSTNRPEKATPKLSTVQQTPRKLVVHVRYMLSLSYFDQISHSAGRIQSHQCWAAKMDSKIVEPFVVDTSYFGGLTSKMDTSSAIRLRDLFDMDHWNRRSLENSIPPLISWEEFLQTATRQVILVRNNFRQLFRNEPFRCTEQDFEKLKAFWTQFLEPHGFQIFKKVCVDLKKRSEFTKVIVSQGSDIDVTVIIDDWREMIGARGPSLPYMVTDSKCDKKYGGDTDTSWLKPSPGTVNDSDMYISKYLNTDHRYIAVMLRWETALWAKHMNGARCMAKILEGVKRMQQQKNTSLMFLATDAGNLGSDLMARVTRYSMVDTRFREEALKHTEKLLQTVFDPPISLAEYERQFEFLQIKNPAYISIVQKIIAARADCLLLLPAEGKFQRHALELYKSFHKNQTECTEEIKRC